MKVDAKAVKKGVPTDYTPCDAKYGAKWTSVEGQAGGACPVTGDHAAIRTRARMCTHELAAAIGVHARFVDNGDGTITDSFTGLMWEKKTELNLSANLANPHDADNVYVWSGTCTGAPSKYCQQSAAAAALCAANVDGAPYGCAECTGGEGTCHAGPPGATIWQWLANLNGANFAGYSDWRVPTRLELEGILDLTATTPPITYAAFHGGSCGVACTDPTSAACSCTQSHLYWSASTYLNPMSARVVFFNDGSVGRFEKAVLTLYVRAVRGGW